MTFEEWFESQYFYTNMRYRFGDALFLKDGDVYRKLPVQMTYMAWKVNKGTDPGGYQYEI